jgi:hypothetical protein
MIFTGRGRVLMSNDLYRKGRVLMSNDLYRKGKGYQV